MARAKNDSEQPVVRRIKASEDKQPTAKRPLVRRKRTVINGDAGEPKKGFFSKFFGYFKGAWHELKQVRWPNRRATWSMTAALLIFTAIFVAFILVIDLVFESLFKLIVG